MEKEETLKKGYEDCLKRISELETVISGQLTHHKIEREKWNQLKPKIFIKGFDAGVASFIDFMREEKDLEDWVNVLIEYRAWANSDKEYALGEKNGKCQKRAMRIGIKILGEGR